MPRPWVAPGRVAKVEDAPHPAAIFVTLPLASPVTYRAGWPAAQEEHSSPARAAIGRGRMGGLGGLGTADAAGRSDRGRATRIGDQCIAAPTRPQWPRPAGNGTLWKSFPLRAGRRVLMGITGPGRRC